MGFNKKKGISAAAVIILLAIFSLITFLLPVAHGITFWIGFSFAILSGVLFCSCLLFLFDSGHDSRMFLRVPVAKIGWGYFVIQILVSVWEILSFPAPYLVALLLDCLLTGFFLVAVLASKAAGEAIESQDAHTAEKVFFLKNMQSILSTIKTEDPRLAQKLESLREDFRFSDPMSHSMLSEMEKQIESKVIALKSLADDPAAASKEVDNISDLLKERNRKCKMLKNVKENDIPQDHSGVKYVAVTIGLLGILTTLALVICFLLIPNNRYQAATALYEQGQYEEAITAFEELEGFGDSDKMIDAAKTAILEKAYQEALSLFENEQYDEAITAFEALGNYSDSAAKIEEIKTAINERDYQIALKLFEEKKYEEAISAFEKLNAYKDSQEQIKAIQDAAREDQYVLAEKYYNEQEYLEARKLYTDLGDYKDSKEKIEQIQNLLETEDVIYFGSYKNEPVGWKILESKDDRMLLIADNPVCEMPYHEEIKNVDWIESSLYAWLNEEFINSFSEDQLRTVLATDIDGTECRAFLLSREEAENLEDPSVLEGEQDWWLRTKAGTNAVYVTKSGEIVTEGDSVVRAKGVRPCIWIDLTTEGVSNDLQM